MTKSQQRIIMFYFALMAICVLLVIVGLFAGPTARSDLLPVASDAFKTILGATIRALSAILGTTTKKEE